MFCLECRSEYVAGVAVCADCGAPLVAGLPEAPPPEFVEYEPVLSTPSPVEIAVIKSVLQEAGIDFRFLSEIAGPPLILPARLLVPKHQAAEAREILARVVETGPASGGEGDDEDA